MEKNKIINDKILAISVSGIGNTLLFLPVLKNLKNIGYGKTDLLVMNESVARLIGGDFANKIYIMPKNIFGAIKLILELRKNKYLHSITAFPSNRWQFNLFSFLAGAKNRITHSYAASGLKTLDFLQNKKIPANQGLHDIDQNISLFKAFFYSGGSKITGSISIALSEHDKKFADDFLKKSDFDKKILAGIHPGGGGDFKSLQGRQKRWPIENYIDLCDNLIDKNGYAVLVFGGGEEREEMEFIKKKSKNKDNILLINLPLDKAAALIAKCEFFISNDTGLMHIAASVNTPVLGIFGPTNSARTSPRNGNCHVIKSGAPCSPCLEYPFRSTSSKIKCEAGYSCLKQISVNEVYDFINSKFPLL